jgi:glycosyltransferase involved in cell wall biosynthesis
MTGNSNSQGTTPDGRDLDIGFWFPRPERGARLAEALRRRGHAVTIYHHLPVPGDQTDVRRVDYDLLGGLRILRRLGHDVMYTSRSFLPVLQLRINKLLTGRPYVYTLNGAAWAYHGERRAASRLPGAAAVLYPWLLKRAVGGASAVVANSAFLARELRARFPARAARISTIYNGIDYEAVEAGNERAGEWPPGDVRILSVVTSTFGRKTEGIRLLLHAFDLMCRRHQGLSYLIAARTTRPAAVEMLRDALKNLACADRVKLVLNRRDVPDLLASADLFLYATPADSSDSLPRALLEAQAAGVPTVTTATTGCAEAVLEGETGRAVPYDAEALAEAALELLRVPEKAAGMAARGARSVRERFSWETMAREYEDIFLRVAGRTPADPQESAREGGANSLAGRP